MFQDLMTHSVCWSDSPFMFDLPVNLAVKQFQELGDAF
jgi:hypothetical protein